jgi:sialidase-1
MSSSLGSPKVVFDPAGSGYHTFRIPAITGFRDALFAFCEGRRHGSGDAGEIEVVLRRSYDGGASWDAPRVVTAVPGKTCGNPTPVVDPASGDLVLLTQQNAADTAEDAVQLGMADPEAGRRVFVQRSADGGTTWTPPDEITAAVKPAGWAWYATGPCHAIALEHGPHAGRLVAPANHSAPSPGTDPAAANGGHCLLSDDGGHTWRLGFVDRNDGTGINANETTVAELPDGRLYFSSRNHRGTSTARVGAWSSDGGASLDAPYAGIPEITAPGIQGSVLAPPGGRLLLTTPAHPSIRRELTLFASDDAGRGWRPGLVLHEGMAGYSDLVPLPGGRVGVLYEAGETSSFATLRFTTFDPATL